MSYESQYEAVSAKWVKRYLDLAEEVSTWSKDPSSKIGSVYIGQNGQVLSTGYNGFPRGIEDSLYRLADRETKYKYVVHAEMNGIYNACQNGVSLAGSKLFVFGLPICSECAKGIIQVGVSEVFIMQKHINKSDFWKDMWETSKEMFIEASVGYRIIG